MHQFIDLILQLQIDTPKFHADLILQPPLVLLHLDVRGV